MRFKLIILWAVCCLPTFGCTTSKLTEVRGQVIEFDRYKQRGKFVNDDQCLSSIFTSYAAEELTIEFSSKQYVFKETIYGSRMSGKWNLIGKQRTEFIVENTFLNVEASSCSSKLSQVAKRDSKYIHTSGFPFDVAMVHLSSEDIVETAWNSKANDLMRVSRQNHNALEFSDSLNFSYKPESTTITGYGPAFISLSHISFYTKAGGKQILSLTGVSVNISDCAFITTDSVTTPALVTLYNCTPVNVTNTTINGNADYGFLINGSRDVAFQHIRSEKCTHPLAPATWTTDVYVEDLYCKGSVIDAHPSFNVKYKDVTIEDGVGYWNCRALGVVLENCTFMVNKAVNESSLYLGLVALHPDYNELYDEYDVNCKNVTWLHRDYGFNGLHVHKCRDFIVDHCTTHAVSTGDFIRTFKVTDSNVGRVYCSDSNFEVKGTNFDAKLQQVPQPLPALSCSYDGTIRLDSCSFTHYDSTYLFRYIQSADTKVYLNHCSITSVKGFAETSYLPADNYNGIKVNKLTSNTNLQTVFNPYSRIEYVNTGDE